MKYNKQIMWAGIYFLYADQVSKPSSFFVQNAFSILQNKSDILLPDNIPSYREFLKFTER